MNPMKNIFILLLLSFYISIAHSAGITVAAHRSIQFDLNGEQYGSRKSTLNIPVVADINVTDLNSNFYSLHRRAVLLADDIDIDIANSIIFERLASGIILIPSKNITKYIEQLVIEKSLDCAIWFVEDTDIYFDNFITNLKCGAINRQTYIFSKEIELFYANNCNEITNNDADSFSNYQVILKKEPEIIKNPISTVMSTNLLTTDRDTSLPTIAIISNFDSLSTSPTFPPGPVSGTGFSVLVSLMRFFYKLHKEYKVKPSFNLLFIASGDGKLHHQGLKSYLDTINQRNLENIDFALCLDELFIKPNDNDKLFLRVSRPAKTEETKLLYNIFNSTAHRMNIPFEIIQKKVNISNVYPDWPHELLSKKFVFSMTLSSNKDRSSKYSSITDISTPFDIDSVKSITDYLISVLTQYQYLLDFSSVSPLLKPPFGINQNFLRAFVDYLSITPRPMPLLRKDSDVLNQIEKYMSKYSNTNVQRYNFPLNLNTTFYRDLNFPKSSVITIIRVKPFYFDLVFTLLLIVGFFITNIILQKPSSFHDIKLIIFKMFTYKQK